MAGREISFITANIIGVAATGTITLAATTGFYKGAIVWLNAGGQPAKQAIVRTVTSTKLGVSFYDTAAGTAPGYGFSDPTLYNGGTVTQHDQFIYDKSDGAF